MSHRGVRGTTSARHRKKVIIREGQAEGEKIFCAWLDCDNDGFEQFKVRVNYGATGQPYTVWYVFCCENHRQYWIHSHRDHGNLPEGYRLPVL